MRDFTLYKYGKLLNAVLCQRYSLQTFEEYITVPASRFVILRHDVDKLPRNAVEIAEIENRLGIKSSFHFRARTIFNNPGSISKIASLDHEICYHYEDLQLLSCNDYKLLRKRDYNVDIQDVPNIEKAFGSFKKNLSLIRGYYPVKVVSMHGRPLSRIDNRLLWEYFDYKLLGIICEPYFDIDYSKVLYITDTGRTWNNNSVNLRDKVAKGYGKTGEEPLNIQFRFKSTDELVNAIETQMLPDGIIINTHPQRWTSSVLPWIIEWGMQSLKNFIKQSRIVTSAYPNYYNDRFLRENQC